MLSDPCPPHISACCAPDERCSVTSADVSELLTRLGTVGKTTINKVYDKILPPVSRFGGGGRAKKKQSVIEKLKGFFEKYFGIGGSTKSS